MFDAMNGPQTQQVFQWLIYSSTICMLAHTLRKTLESFWNRPKQAENHAFLSKNTENDGNGAEIA